MTAIYQLGAYNAAVANGVPPEIYTGLIQQESGFNPNAVSSTGAVGIAQFLPSTAASPGYGVAPFDPNDPQASLNAGAQYLRAFYDKFGSWGQAVTAYNQGPGAVASGTTTNQYSSAFNSLVSSIGGGITGAVGGAASYLFGGIVLRLFAGFIALMLIGLGVAALALKSDPGEVAVSVASKTI